MMSTKRHVLTILMFVVMSHRQLARVASLVEFLCRSSLGKHSFQGLVNFSPSQSSRNNSWQLCYARQPLCAKSRIYFRTRSLFPDFGIRARPYG
ncbi:uncharacterized protein F5147DRAFT_724100 [Suillus discolor]|uniref:Secreted protein n=1 Tax=Suillus discolor TaxID=1912936 RepID=A0A9P7JN34_9AGAM|nr:uncharacterized protein F5147DRAFT_724100 [Suillus discolor]KAG2091021.1 hypothetical protein F5147DRAFT_724100 [Suillus discolor]